MKKSLMRLTVFSLLLLFTSCAKTVEKPVIVEKPVVIEKPVYVKPKLPPLPERPKLDKVEFDKVGKYYCLTPAKAKKLLKNIYKLDNYARELEVIIKTIQNQSIPQ